MNTRKLIPLLLSVACVAAVSCVKESRDGDSHINVGDAIPTFSVSGPAGTVSSSSFTGKGGLLVLFASYCPSCKDELPEVERVWKASEENGLFVVAPLSRQGGDETEKAVAALWDGRGYTMPYYIDTGAAVYNQFAKQWIPRLYVVDKQGKVTFMTVGESDVKAEKIVSELEKALGINIDL